MLKISEEKLNDFNISCTIRNNNNTSRKQKHRLHLNTVYNYDFHTDIINIRLFIT